MLRLYLVKLVDHLTSCTADRKDPPESAYRSPSTAEVHGGTAVGLPRPTPAAPARNHVAKSFTVTTYVMYNTYEGDHTGAYREPRTDLRTGLISDASTPHATSTGPKSISGASRADSSGFGHLPEQVNTMGDSGSDAGATIYASFRPLHRAAAGRLRTIYKKRLSFRLLGRARSLRGLYRPDLSLDTLHR